MSERTFQTPHPPGCGNKRPQPEGCKLGANCVCYPKGSK